MATQTLRIAGFAGNFPGQGHDYYPLVFTTDGTGKITSGYQCAATNMPLNDIVIPQQQDPPPANTSYLLISTQHGQYQMFWHLDSGTYYIMLQSTTSSEIYPNNLKNLWTGTQIPPKGFKLNIDMTSPENPITLGLD